MNSQQNSEIQQLYQSSKLHLSDLVFLEDEMKFLKSLLSKFFLPMMHAKSVTRAQLIDSHLSQLSLVKANVSIDLLIYQGKLNSTINELELQSIDFLKLASSRIDDEIKDLNRSFRNIKKEIFVIYKDLTPQESATAVTPVI